jgi:hypothetical protein
MRMRAIPRHCRAVRDFAEKKPAFATETVCSANTLVGATLCCLWFETILVMQPAQDWRRHYAMSGPDPMATRRVDQEI